jgi:two-component SAPR family response regulator
MSQRILIVDDNHSFIDTVKVLLKDFSFLYDSSFRFSEAEKKLSQYGGRLNREIIQSLTDYDSKLQAAMGNIAGQSKKKNQEVKAEPVELPEIPEINEELTIDNGYSLVLVEQDTETSMKGIQFIESQIRSAENLNPSDFILLCSKPELIEEKAKSMGVIVVEKPVRGNVLKNVVAQKTKLAEETLSKAQRILAEIQRRLEAENLGTNQKDAS